MKAALNSHAKDLSRVWQGKILWNSPMAQFSSLKVGGPAEAVISAANTGDLKELVKWLTENDIAWWVVGRGSNILVPDTGLAGVVIFLEGEFSSIEKIAAADTAAQEVLLRAGGGCPLAKLVSFCTAEGLSGLEFAIGIPGSIGGAIVMNAGAWGHEIASIVDSVSLMDNRGTVRSEKAENLGFSYRKWAISSETILLSATFRLAKGHQDDIKEACRKYQELRRKNQPITEPSAGSFFKNPPADSAGRLIEEAGLKGFSIGGAKISEKHANFIVNTGSASATDILNVMHLVQQQVYKRFGIRLEPEVHILGEIKQ